LNEKYPALVKRPVRMVVLFMRRIYAKQDFLPLKPNSDHE